MKGWRTIFINVGLALIPVLDYVLNNGTILAALIANPVHMTLAIAGINIVNIILRFVTTTPIGKSSKEHPEE
jgi:hypothetical protein